MTHSGPLEDRMLIRETIEAYGDAVNRADAEAWSKCWADDGVWLILGNEVVGREALVQFWKGLMDNFVFAGFIVTPGSIEVSGDRATMRAYASEELFGKDGTVTRIRGRYDDELRKEGGRWVFAKRDYTILHRHES